MLPLSKIRLYITLSILIPLTVAQQSTILDDVFGDAYRKFLVRTGHIVRHNTDSIASRSALVKQNKAAKQLTADDSFPCNLENVKLRSDAVPESVHQLRPGDIDIIAGLGDSLSAGTGISAVSLIYEMVPQRGRAWSSGGEKTWRSYLTLPNILKVFNPSLFGYALKASQSVEWESQFNVAENGAISEDLLYMSRELVKRIQEDKRVDLKNHWKMITLMIGDNDFCLQICLQDNAKDAVKRHREDLLAVLRYLRDNLPRTVVNVVPPPRLDEFYDMEYQSLACYIVHNVACPCIRGLKYKNSRKLISDLMFRWHQAELEVSNLPEFDLDDFTVISHTFTLNLTLPRTPQGDLDFSFLAPDCFHLSEKGQSRMANDLWNSLLEPYGKKSIDSAPTFSKFNCPSEEHPYIFTRRNSQLNYNR